MIISLIKLNNKIEVVYELIHFSGGELHPQIKNICELKSFTECNSRSAILIESDNISSSQLIELSLVIDAIKQIVGSNIRCLLSTTYLPYARQDRVCAKGDAFSLKVFFSLLKASGVDSVDCSDVHSEKAFNIAKDVGIKLYSKPQWIGLEKSYKDILQLINKNKVLIIAPDKGAIHKVKELYKISGTSKEDISYFDKVRNPSTGEITNMVLNANYEDLHSYDKVLLVDDICDGGRTFIEAAKILTHIYNIPKDKIELYVTHGIFSKGVEVIKDWFNRVSCINNLQNKKTI